MFEILFFVAGLVIGWNVLPQPDWVKAIYDKAIATLREKL